MRYLRLATCGSRFQNQPRRRLPALTPSVLCLLYVLSVLYWPALCGETIYLQSGEEYVGTIERIARGRLHALIGGQPQAFPLDQVHRIEFQRRRLLDEVTKASELPQHMPFFAEALAPTTDDLRRRFPQAGYIVTAEETVLTIRANGAWEAKSFYAWRILDDRGAESAMRYIHYFPDREEAEVLFALTVAPDGSVAHLADTAMKDEALYPRLPAYNFRHRLRFTLKNATIGATLFLATAHRGRASLLHPCVLDKVFWEEEPALKRSVRLAVEEGAKDLVATATANGPKDWGRDGLWEVRDAPQIFREPMMPPAEAFAPRLLLVYPKASWADVAQAFSQRAGTAAALPTKGVPPRALFDRVRQAIRLERVPLAALPDGPAPPATVLVRGYGNDVERALLLAALLRGAGHHADVILARRRDDGPLLPSAPHLRAFSEAVVRLTEPDGKVTWLEADHEDRGFGELDPEVQGAEGLDLATSNLVTVPVLPPAAEAALRTVEVELAPDGTATVRDAYKLTGRFAADYRQLKDLTQDQLHKWAIRFVSGEATGVDLLDFTHSDFGNANTEERLSFTYRVPRLAEKAGNFLILRLPNARLSTQDVGRSTRERDLFWRGVEREEATFTVKAPPGYAVYALGQKVEKRGQGWTLAAEFAPDPAAQGLVRFRDLWERSALTAPRDAYAAYRDARIARSRLRGEVIVFVKQ